MAIICGTPNCVGSEALSHDIYERMLPELQALPAVEITQINLAIPNAVATVLGALPLIRALREQMSQLPSDFDVTHIDRLEDYAMALSHANTLHTIATQPPDDLQAVYCEALKLREILYTDVKVLIRRGLIDDTSIKDLRGLKGYKNVANDLQILGSLLKANWANVEGNCGTRMTELDRTLTLAPYILRVVALREQRPVLVAAAADIRARAFTLLMRTYDQVRRAVVYLRWHEGDANTIAPSLFAGRSNGHKKSNVATARSSTYSVATTAGDPVIASTGKAAPISK